jgi:hypothetical protein
MRRILALATGLLASAALAACGTSERTRSSATASVATTQSASSKVATGGTRAQPRTLADYDDDDYLHGYEDNDPDDRHEPKDRDGDIDAESAGHYYDRDDGSVRKFGRPATPSERRPIVALAKRYYSAAASDDGARICAMIYRPLARSYVETVGEHGPRFVRGLKSCSQILSRFFGGASQSVAFDLRLGITQVRVARGIGLVVLGNKPFPIRVLEVVREHGKWFLYGSLDSEMP